MKVQKSAFDLWWNLCRLGLETQTVIALRMMKLAAGGTAAKAESRRMLREKIDAYGAAHTDAAIRILTGRGSDVPSRTTSRYRRRVRANARRLSSP